MNYPILSTRITETTLISLRDRARQVGEIFGLDKLESTRFITAVSEIGRNTVQYAGGGTAAFSFRGAPDPSLPQSIVAIVTDSGPGIMDIQGVWAGHLNGKGQVPLGLAGARRMVDTFTVQNGEAGGTIVMLEVFLARTTPRLTQDDLNTRTRELIARKPKTPLQELEKQNSEMLATLQELRTRETELKRADERKNDFLSMLAHELSNPLGTLSLNLEVLRRNPEHIGKCCETMERQTQQMGKLIDDLMDVSRVSQGKVRLDMKPLEVNDIVMRALEMCSSALESKQHAVTFQRHDSEVWVAGDSTRLKQVISNLITNAARYTPVRGHINVAVTKRAATVDITVADNGMGIAREMLHDIFDMFVQGDSATKESHGGLGIGLTLVRRLVEKHGGSVTATSDGMGNGSMFIVSLPLFVGIMS